MEIKDPDILLCVERAKSYSTELKLPRPYHVIMGEGIDTAREGKFYWDPEVEPGTGKVLRRGLSSVNTASKQRLAPTIFDDLRVNQRACQAAHSQHLYASGVGGNPEDMKLARFYLTEITSVLQYEFDDDKWDANDEALAALDAEHAEDPQSADAVASAIDDYVGLARPLGDTIDGVAGFEIAYLEKAVALAAKLREKPTQPAAVSADAAAWMSLRNRLTNMLMADMGKVNGAGKLVFRDRPDIARKFASAYERKRRAEARRKAKKKAEEEKKNEG
jgi:hypothetical protein